RTYPRSLLAALPTSQARPAGQLLDTQRLIEVLAQPLDGAGYALTLAVGDHHFMQAMSLRTERHAIEDFAQRQRRQHGDVTRGFQQAQQADHRIQQTRVEAVE